MYHSRWSGSHEEAGYKYGNMLFTHNKAIDFDLLLNEEKLHYAKNVLDIYKKYYPEIVEEIKGFSQGLREDFIKVFSFLTSMYVFTFENYCSAIGISNYNGVYFARNSDFDISIEKMTDSAFYKLDKGYSFIGNTTAMIQMEDGINEKGLACGLTFVYPTVRDFGFNAGFLIRYILEKCSSVEEAKYFLENVEIGSSQNIIIADSKGNVMVAELNSKKKYFNYLEDDYGLFRTNHFVSDEMIEFQCNLEDEIYSQKRYETLNSQDYGKYDTHNLFELLKGEKGFLCQYDRKNKFDTIWSSLYDISNKKIYRCEGNPSRRKFVGDTRLKFTF